MESGDELVTDTKKKNPEQMEKREVLTQSLSVGCTVVQDKYKSYKLRKLYK